MNESRHPAGQPADSHPSAAAQGPGYEVRDTNVRAIVGFMGCLFLFVFVAQMGLWALLGSYRDGGDEPFVKPVVVAPPALTGTVAPPAEFGIVEQFHRLRSYEDDVLAGKGPAGVSSGKTVISVERAVDLLTDRGIPPLPGPARTEDEVNAHSGAPAENAQGEKE